MKREFKYSVIRLEDIDINPHLIFICDGDYKKVIVESEKENNE
jgi:hypothetical protein